MMLVNDQLGDKFKIEREIARGGAARVFLAMTNEGERVAPLENGEIVETQVNPSPGSVQQCWVKRPCEGTFPGTS